MYEMGVVKKNHKEYYVEEDSIQTNSNPPFQKSVLRILEVFPTVFSYSKSITLVEHFLYKNEETADIR
jgi:hypothetical protein